MKNFLVPFLTILALVVLSFIAGKKTAEKGQKETVIERVDTLVIRDTIVAYRPQYITRRVVDTAFFPVTDTIRMRDTLFLQLPREQVTWEDSLARVYASGINPQVDSVYHYRTETVINHIIPVKVNPLWGFGIQGGVGVGKGGLTPYVGVGFQMNLFSW